jgi:hypothetical protein
MALGSAQSLTEMCTINIPGDKYWPARKAHNFIALSESRLSKKIWESRCLAALWASTAYYRDRFFFYFTILPFGVMYSETLVAS